MPEPGNLGPGEGGGSGSSPGRFGGLLLACRRAAGLTQEELAARSGMSVRAISDLERGRATVPQRRSAELLGEALGLSGTALTDFLVAARAGRLRRTLAAAPSGQTRLASARCTLPIDVADFTARHQELDRLRTVAGRAAGERAGPAQVVAISGQPGVGKTALAVHAGHLLAGTFPDAQMYVDLRGMDERPLSPEAALGRLLHALGQPDERIPAEAEDRESFYRALTHDCRVLVVLDNAASEAQVRPLLLAGDRCLTLITSRRVLAGLAAVTQVPLEVLPAQTALALLGDIVGPDRMTAEHAAAREVARLCGGLLTSLCTAAAAAFVVIVLHSPRGRARLRRPTAGVIRMSQRLLHRPAGDPAAVAAGVLQRLGAFNLTGPAIGYAFGCALVNWAADAACLAAAIAAIGVPVPWDKLLLIWSAGAAAASFSPTPYGLGIVDIALITALRGAGLAAPEAVGAVLLYRVITFKILVTLLWITYRYLQDRHATA